ncbi:hypothetical protein PENARI_c004G00794 [Penicillium arizonense]|uniref:Uncharacterized protein n=1 Tax=Penicillium arizonense TaxID=1835702 RepID=A0A1F5LRB0_PENAI|nr:hypothetical protein PENARI_c004G00794 [Penicillium arizonense]OGE55748.1 hypothetical protein PENARI_c004G00794 [Penicillium arizonense]
MIQCHAHALSPSKGGKKAKFADTHKWVDEDDVYYDFIEQMAIAHARRAVEEAVIARRIRRRCREGHSGNGGKKWLIFLISDSSSSFSPTGTPASPGDAYYDFTSNRWLPRTPDVRSKKPLLPGAFVALVERDTPGTEGRNSANSIVITVKVTEEKKQK